MDAKILQILRKEGYRNIRNVPGIGWCGVMDMLFTVGVFCGLTEYCYEFRYCYPKELGTWIAEQELKKWDGKGHIGGNWIKCKWKWEDIINPNYRN